MIGRLSTWIGDAGRPGSTVSTATSGQPSTAIELAGRRRDRRTPRSRPSEGPGRAAPEVATDRVAGDERSRRVLQPPAEGEALAERHELGDRQVAVRLVEERGIAHDRSARVGDQDDLVAAAVADPADGVGQPRADDRGLDRIVEEHGQVAERADELGVEAGQLRPIPDGLDRNRPERRIDRQGEHAGQRRHRAQEPPDRLVLPDPVEPVDPLPAQPGRGPKLGDLRAGSVVPGLGLRGDDRREAPGAGLFAQAVAAGDPPDDRPDVAPQVAHGLAEGRRADLAGPVRLGQQPAGGRMGGIGRGDADPDPDAVVDVGIRCRHRPARPDPRRSRRATAGPRRARAARWSARR